MARKTSADGDIEAFQVSLSRPRAYVLSMLLFLVLIGLLTAILFGPIHAAFNNNPFLNGIIISTLFIGILYTFHQVFRLYPEIRWVNAFRMADPGLAIPHQPQLLAPMANMLRDRRGQVALNATSMRSLLDSIAARLDEARDMSRYLVGLLIFLGLLGTFWGLLDTIQSVGKTISSLDTSGSDSLVIFEELKTGLEAPLKGMGTAFSSSLFGLAGSLVLGFLDLQASRAQNRFYNELEDWLSIATDLTPGSAGADNMAAQLRFAVGDMQRAVDELGSRLQNGAANGDGGIEATRELATGIEKLVRQMRSEQKVVREWVDEQAAQQAELTAVLRELNSRLTGG